MKLFFLQIHVELGVSWRIFSYLNFQMRFFCQLKKMDMTGAIVIGMDKKFGMNFY